MSENMLIMDKREKMALRAWLELTRCTKTLETSISAKLRRNFGQSFTRFDAMSQLYRADNMTLPVTMLASQILSSTTKNITGLMDRMEKDLLVSRNQNSQDRRSYTITLTHQGKSLFEEMAVEHGHWITESFMDMSEDKLTDMIESITHLRKNLED